MDGEQAPDFTLTHLEGRSVSLKDFRGHKVVAVFASRDTGDQASTISQTLRGRFRHDELVIVSVLDMHALPRLMQPVAKALLKKAYNDAVEQLRTDLQAKEEPPPADPSQFVVMLPDWDGKVTASFGVEDVKNQAVAILIDEDGRRIGSGAGAQGADQILAILG